MPEDVIYERRGAAAVVTIDRQERRNAVDGPTADLLADAYRRFEADDEARVLVLTGARRAWPSAPAPTSRRSRASGRGWSCEGGPLGFTRLISPKPTIAAISGWCLAGGLELALWCDLRVATADATLGFTERRFGVPLIDGGTQRLPRIVGLGRALDMILSGRIVEAEEAHSIGLVNEVVPAGRHLDRALEMAEALARFPQDTMLADRRAAIEGFGLPLEEALRLEARAALPTLETAWRGAAALRRRRGPRRRRRRGLSAGGDRGHATCDKSYGPVEAVRGAVVRGRAGRGVRPARPQRGRARRPPSRSSRATATARRGEVRVLGHDPERPRPPASRSASGIVLQSSRLLPAVTVREAVEPLRQGLLGAARRGRDDRPRRTRREGRRPHRRPQRRPAPPPRPRARPDRRPRADLPRRAHHRLRPGGAPHRLGTSCGSLRDLGKTVLLTTHYLEEAQELADRVAIVKDGRIVAEGPPDELGPEQRALPRLLPVRRAPRGAPDRRPDRAAAPADERRARPRRAPRRARGQRGRRSRTSTSS